MQQCPLCGGDFATDLQVCPHCGGVEGAVHECPRCGGEYRGADACPVCGALRIAVPCDLHPERSASDRCVICGRAMCPACRASEGRAAYCDAHAGVMVIEGWAQVYTATSDFEAQLLRENLRAEGIAAQIYSQRDRTFSVDLGELSIVRLMVPVWEYDHALSVIHEHMDTAGEVVFACPSCGEAFDPGARECTGCGSPLV